MAPRVYAKPLVVMFQAFIDESEDATGAFVMAGHVAPIDVWAKFSADWERMLPKGGLLHEDGYWHFHMLEMAKTPERMARVRGFYRLIENQLPLSVSVRMNERDLRRARRRIYVPGVSIDFGFTESAWMLSFRALIDSFHSSKVRTEAGLVGALPIDAKVDFIFDEHSKEGQVRRAWDAYVAERPDDAQARFGRLPRFEKDHEYPGLQAADLWAWWVRKWQAEGVASERISNPIFDGWTGGRRMPAKLDIYFSEDDLVDALKALIRSLYPKGLQIYDLKTSG